MTDFLPRVSCAQRDNTYGLRPSVCLSHN